MKKSAQVIIRYEDYVILQRRDHNTNIYEPGKLGFFGGAIEDSETPEKAARREIREEIVEEIDLSRLRLLKDEIVSVRDGYHESVKVHMYLYELELLSDVFSVAEGEGKISISLDDVEKYKPEYAGHVYDILKWYKLGDFR